MENNQPEDREPFLCWIIPAFSVSLVKNFFSETLVPHMPVLFNLAEPLGSPQRNPSFLGHDPAIAQAQVSLLIICIETNKGSFSVIVLPVVAPSLYHSGSSTDLLPETLWPRSKASDQDPGETCLDRPRVADRLGSVWIHTLLNHDEGKMSTKTVRNGFNVY